MTEPLTLTLVQTLTLHLDLGVSGHRAQLAGGQARVVGRLLDVVEQQERSADRGVLLRRGLVSRTLQRGHCQRGKC